jgi:outer membrane protein insertion porin family
VSVSFKKRLLICLGVFLFLFLSTQDIWAEEDTEEIIRAGTKVYKILISANKLLSTEELLSFYSMREGDVFTKDAVIQDLKSIFSSGYYQKENINVIPSFDTESRLILEYKLLENPPIRDLKIYGNHSLLNVYDYFVELVGKPQNVKLLSQKIKELEEAYYKEGYIVARVKDIELEEDGTLKIFIDEGLIGEIKFTGNEKTKRKYLDHLLKNSKVGEPYNEKFFSEDFKRLQGTGYFGDISRVVIPREGSDDYELEIKVQEKRQISIGAGAGINTSTGLFGNLNLGVRNIRGEGHTLSINSLFGTGIGSNLTFQDDSDLFRRDEFFQVGINYSIPYFMDSDYFASTGANFEYGPNYKIDLVNQTRWGGLVSASRSLDANNSLRLSSSFDYIDLEDRDRQRFLKIVTENAMEQKGLGKKEAREKAKEIREKQIVDGVLLGVDASYLFQDLDSRTRPRSGSKIRLGLDPKLGLGDVSSYTALSGSFSNYVPLPKESTFLFNVRTGYELFGDIPQFDMFRLGGVRGVRGYSQFSQLGVGTKLAISTAELRTPIYNMIPPLKKVKYLRDIDFAVFGDAGILGENDEVNNLTDKLNKAISAGFGLRLHVPLLGSLRIDLGFPLIEPLFNSDYLFRLNFGPADPY